MNSYNELLLEAIGQNDFVCAEYCLRKGANVNKICSGGKTALGTAAESGNFLILKMLLGNLNNLVDINLEALNERTFKKNIGYFVVCKDIEENEFGEGPTPDGMEALEWDMEVTDDNIIDEDENAIVEVNMYKWYAKILSRTSMFLESPDNDIARLDSHGQNILHYGVSSGHIEIVEYLITNYKELRINQCDKNSFTSLHIAVMKGHVEMVQLLILKGANPNCVNRERQTPLHIAGHRGDTEIINILIKSGGNVNAYDIQERSPLTFAVLYNNEEAAAVLIKNGTKLNYEETCGFTVLYRAVWNNLTYTTDILLQAGAKIKQSHCLLHVATRNNNIEIVNALLKAGVIINFRDDQGNTPLMIACATSNILIAKYLLKNGASVNTPNQINGMTACHICVQEILDHKMFKLFLDLLLSYNVDLNVNSYLGNVLFYAIILGKLSTASILVKHGADVNLREERSCFDTLSLAKKHGNLELVKLIVYAGFNFKNLMFQFKSLKNENEDPAYDFLVRVSSSPLKLRELCRIRVRKTLNRNLIHKIYQLQLPIFLLSYLSLDIL